MPLLSPKKQNESFELELLKESGALEVIRGIQPTIPVQRQSASHALSKKGLSLEETCGYLAELIENTDSDALKMKGVETALKIHGAFDGTEVNTTPQIVFQIEGGINLLGMFNPVR
jgi:hypothetical protein